MTARALSPDAPGEEPAARLAEQAPPKVVTHYDPKPIPLRHCDWSAVLDGYEPGDPIGWGATEEQARADLAEQIEERA